jgi:hypothetical protein
MAAVTRGLDAEAYDRQYQDKELLRRILRYFRPHRRKVIIVTICIFLMALSRGGAAADCGQQRGRDDQRGRRPIGAAAHWRGVFHRYWQLGAELGAPPAHLGSHCRRHPGHAPGRVFLGGPAGFIVLRRVQHGPHRQPHHQRHAGVRRSDCDNCDRRHQPAGNSLHFDLDAVRHRLASDAGWCWPWLRFVALVAAGVPAYLARESHPARLTRPG